MTPHVRTWTVVAAVDWPAGVARKWPGKGELANPQGDNRRADVAGVVAENPAEAFKLAVAHLWELGHRWVRVLQTVRTPDLEEKAAELVQEALERAAYDARAQRARDKTDCWCRGLDPDCSKRRK